MAKLEKKPSSHPEAKGLLLLSASFLLLLCLLSFKSGQAASNWLGLIGYYFAWGLTFVFGLTSYLLLFYVGWTGYKLLLSQEIPNQRWKHLFFGLFVVSACLLLNLIAEHSSRSFFASRVYEESVLLHLPYPHLAKRYNLGGVPFYYLYRDLPNFNLQRLFNDVGIGMTFSLTALVSFLFFTELQLIPLVKKIKLPDVKTLLKPKEKESAPPAPAVEKPPIKKTAPEPIYMPNAPLKEKEAKARTPAEPILKESAFKSISKDFTGYQLPPPSLLTSAKKVDQPTLKKDLKRQADILEETLLSFGIEAKVGEIYCGPTITSFEVHPAVGVKVQKIKALENDIALNLQAKSIRIIAPIPGKAAVGVEVPSLYPQEVSFKEMLLSYQQNPRKFHIPVLLGKTVTGENVTSDLTKMPHCIIAGATGSGKSVCINTVILSILMNARPDEIKLIMIDPKKVELTAYTKLPHMIAPVITEAHGAYAALNWLVKEMQTRYDILKQLGVRNITAFNSRPINRELEASLSIPVPEKMYAIVAIIDEFADLMMVSSSDLETPIARIAQMARAVGIHLILATQRPSREVITGLIKANFPTRISFKVASRINSQIILDETGAESLLGNGDMLFLPPGSSHLVRAQGAYLSDDDINKIISFISDQAPTNYLIPSFDQMRKEDAGEEGEDGSRDMLYEQARSIVLETQTASTTFLQRKLKIGYARAASLMDELETRGVIGPQEGSKPRQIFQPKSHAED